MGYNPKLLDDITDLVRASADPDKPVTPEATLGSLGVDRRGQSEIAGYLREHFGMRTRLSNTMTVQRLAHEVDEYQQRLGLAISDHAEVLFSPGLNIRPWVDVGLHEDPAARKDKWSLQLHLAPSPQRNSDICKAIATTGKAPGRFGYENNPNAELTVFGKSIPDVVETYNKFAKAFAKGEGQKPLPSVTLDNGVAR